jgi:hypothetical protein
MNNPDIAHAFDNIISPTISQIDSTESLQSQLLQTVQTILLSSITSVLSNLTNTNVLSTLPVYRPTIGCLLRQFDSIEVQNFINSTITKATSVFLCQQRQLPMPTLYTLNTGKSELGQYAYSMYTVCAKCVVSQKVCTKCAMSTLCAY